MQTDWKANDTRRPHPPVVEPGTTPFLDQPSDAISLFNGKDLSLWQGADGGPAPWRVEGGYLEVSPGTGDIETRQSFGDVQLHVEWTSSPPAEATGQGRGNSGVLLMGLYEVQILDSYRSDTYADGMATAVYGQYPPLANASRPPGEWQTLEIVFRRPRFGAAGRLLQPARMTALHNGVLVQDSVALWGPTHWLQSLPYEPHPPRLPLALQDHFNAVRFRNIWLRELPEEDESGPPPDAGEPTMPLPAEELDLYVGRYRGERMPMPLAIERIGDQLQLAFPSRPPRGHERDRAAASYRRYIPLPLAVVSRETLSFTRTFGKLEFTLDAHGRAETFVLHWGGENPGLRWIRE